MGGYSSEFEISLQSGQVVCDALDTDEFDVYPIHILNDGWYFIGKDGSRTYVDKGSFAFSVEGTKIIPDVIFNTIHGTPGEDGIMAAYWELLKIPQTSSSFYAAALSFNKRDCLSVLSRFGIKCANSFYLNQGGSIDIEEIVKKVGLPCFVKPNRAGSSFGISKVHDPAGLMLAIEKAFEEDSEILIETALVGTEVSVGVYRQNKEVIALPVTEIVSENDFFDYEAKYLGKSDEITPARISELARNRVQAEAVNTYKLLNLEGIARADYIIQQEEPFFIEINTTPGLSAESIVPKQVRETGGSLKEFFGIIIKEALLKNVVH